LVANNNFLLVYRDLVHAKNEGAYATHDWLFVFDKLLVDIPVE
jgi:hypothetical protein